jgi:hypothetical protein
MDGKDDIQNNGEGKTARICSIKNVLWLTGCRRTVWLMLTVSHRMKLTRYRILLRATKWNASSTHETFSLSVVVGTLMEIMLEFG